MSTFRLITGGIGTGKSLWTVEKLFKEYDLNPDRDYYTDITGIKHTGIKPAPEDWREVPNNSVIVYDEVQYKELFSRHNSKRDKQILDLTTMRKRGIEIWVITQRARFLNADVLGLINEHVHLERNGQTTSKVYIWQEAEMNITKSKKMFAFEKYTWAYPTDLYGFYESIQPDSKHNKRSYINKQVVSIAATLLIAIIAIVIFISRSANDGISSSSSNEPKAATDTHKNGIANPLEKPTSPTNPALPTQPNQVQDLNFECRKAENVQNPECVQWFNNLTQSNGSITGGQNAQVVHYDASKPYDLEQVSYNYQVKDIPQFVGCVKFEGKYYGYTQQGTRLKVSQEDCKKFMNGDRPFNPFKDPSSSSSMLTQSDKSTSPVADIPLTVNERAALEQYREQQRPHNNVQPHLMNDQRFANKGGGLSNFS